MQVCTSARMRTHTHIHTRVRAPWEGQCAPCQLGLLDGLAQGKDSDRKSPQKEEPAARSWGYPRLMRPHRSRREIKSNGLKTHYVQDILWENTREGPLSWCKSPRHWLVP